MTTTDCAVYVDSFDVDEAPLYSDDRHNFYLQGRHSVLPGRMGGATDVANAVLFLSCETPGFTAGLEVPVDGGTLAMIGRYERRETS